jgi:hypothetical protein
MRSILATIVLAVPLAGCLDEVDVGSEASEVQASLVDQHFALVQDGSLASRATAMVEVPIRDAVTGAQKMVPSNAGPPFPSS